MKRYRLVVAVIVVVLWGLSAPLAMASNNCMAMGAMCEGPCGASPGALAQWVDAIPVDPAMPGIMLVPGHASAAPLKVPELPPKSLSHFA